MVGCIETYVRDLHSGLRPAFRLETCIGTLYWDLCWDLYSMLDFFLELVETLALCNLLIELLSVVPQIGCGLASLTLSVPFNK